MTGKNYYLNTAINIYQMVDKDFDRYIQNKMNIFESRSKYQIIEDEIELGIKNNISKEIKLIRNVIEELNFNRHKNILIGLLNEYNKNNLISIKIVKKYNNNLHQFLNEVLEKYSFFEIKKEIFKKTLKESKNNLFVFDVILKNNNNKFINSLSSNIIEAKYSFSQNQNINDFENLVNSIGSNQKISIEIPKILEPLQKLQSKKTPSHNLNNLLTSLFITELFHHVSNYIKSGNSIVDLIDDIFDHFYEKISGIDFLHKNPVIKEFFNFIKNPSNFNIVSSLTNKKSTFDQVINLLGKKIKTPAFKKVLRNLTDYHEEDKTNNLNEISNKSFLTTLMSALILGGAGTAYASDIGHLGGKETMSSNYIHSAQEEWSDQILGQEAIGQLDINNQEDFNAISKSLNIMRSPDFNKKMANMNMTPYLPHGKGKYSPGSDTPPGGTPPAVKTPPGGTPPAVKTPPGGTPPAVKTPPGGTPPDEINPPVNPPPGPLVPPHIIPPPNPVPFIIIEILLFMFFIIWWDRKPKKEESSSIPPERRDPTNKSSSIPPSRRDPVIPPDISKPDVPPYIKLPPPNINKKRIKLTYPYDIYAIHIERVNMKVATRDGGDGYKIVNEPNFMNQRTLNPNPSDNTNVYRKNRKKINNQSEFGSGAAMTSGDGPTPDMYNEVYNKKIEKLLEDKNIFKILSESDYYRPSSTSGLRFTYGVKTVNSDEDLKYLRFKKLDAEPEFNNLKEAANSGRLFIIYGERLYTSLPSGSYRKSLIKLKEKFDLFHETIYNFFITATSIENVNNKILNYINTSLERVEMVKNITSTPSTSYILADIV
jgi:hypothetical protein